MTTLNNTSHVDLQESNITDHCHSISSPTGALEGHRASSFSTSEIVGVSDMRRESSVSECSVELVDLESGVHETKLHLSKCERDCRICHMTLDSSYQESGVPIELGCCCKDDLAVAHKHCAETWFKIKGNK